MTLSLITKKRRRDTIVPSEKFMDGDPMYAINCPNADVTLGKYLKHYTNVIPGIALSQSNGGSSWLRL